MEIGEGCTSGLFIIFSGFIRIVNICLCVIEITGCTSL